MSNKKDFLNAALLDINDRDFADIYKNMQGNILKGHGRDHATMIFLQFKASDVLKTKKHLAAFTDSHVTSFYKQLWERERFKRNGVPGDTFGALFISKTGYEYLEKKIPFSDKAFYDGMKSRSELHDPKEGLDPGFENDIDAMILLADHDKSRMDILAGSVIEEIKKIARIIRIEYGDAIRNANGDGLEHNGYVDGISQPLFLKDEVESYYKQHSIEDKKHANFNPAKKTGLVLIKDPFKPGASDCFGSYFVFRKLEQNVQAFKNQEEAIGKDLYGGKGDLKERAGAMLVGRFEDGTPIVEQGEDKLIGSGAFNDFNYQNDPSGGKCPHFAHIRKTNLRENNEFNDNTMARRGIPFGHRNVDVSIPDIKKEQYPTGGVGLLFMSYQRSIEHQFEVIQKAANGTKKGEDPMEKNIKEVDPLIGQIEKNMVRDKYQFPKKDTRPRASMIYHFSQHITFRGGEYFFAPSIPYLLSLGQTDAS